MPEVAASKQRAHERAAEATAQTQAVDASFGEAGERRKMVPERSSTRREVGGCDEAEVGEDVQRLCTRPKNKCWSRLGAQDA